MHKIQLNENDMFYVELSEDSWTLFLRSFLHHDIETFDFQRGIMSKLSEVHPYQIARCTTNGYYPNENMTTFLLQALNEKYKKDEYMVKEIVDHKFFGTCGLEEEPKTEGKRLL